MKARMPILVFTHFFRNCIMTGQSGDKFSALKFLNVISKPKGLRDLLVMRFLASLEMTISYWNEG